MASSVCSAGRGQLADAAASPACRVHHQLGNSSRVLRAQGVGARPAAPRRAGASERARRVRSVQAGSVRPTHWPEGDRATRNRNCPCHPSEDRGGAAQVVYIGRPLLNRYPPRAPQPFVAYRLPNSSGDGMACTAAILAYGSRGPAAFQGREGTSRHTTLLCGVGFSQAQLVSFSLSTTSPPVPAPALCLNRSDMRCR